MSICLRSETSVRTRPDMAISRIPRTSISKRVLVQTLSSENEFDLYANEPRSRMLSHEDSFWHRGKRLLGIRTTNDIYLFFDFHFWFFSCRVSYRVYYFFFPPKHKFLSLEEYVIQGTEETNRALEDLREYCKSPECNKWQLVSRLKNPSRYENTKLDVKLSGCTMCRFIP